MELARKERELPWNVERKREMVKLLNCIVKRNVARIKDQRKKD